MKRSILLLIPLMLCITSCNGQSKISSSEAETIPNQEVVDKLKTILSKQDLSPFHSKYLQGTYSQEYDVLDLDYDEDEKVSNYFNYFGGGVFGIYHDLTTEEYDSIVDENGNIDVFDAIAKGKGYYGYLQLTRTTSFTRKGSYESEIHNLNLLQLMNLKSSDTDVWLSNSLNVSEEGAFNAEHTQYFNSSISKELLFGSLSTRSFREIISKVNLFDAPGNMEHLDKLYYSICRELVSKSDKEISDFILANQISIKEEDNIEVSFVYANEDVEEEELDYIFPGTIKGTLLFDKNTYEYTHFNYEIPYKVETYNEDSGSIKLINTSFSCEGTSVRGLPHDTWEPTDPTVYEDVAEYLKDLDEQVVPPTIYL